MSARTEALGIDFGTSNTAVAVLEGGRARLLAIDPSNRSSPELLKSLLYFPSRKEAFFGQQAVEQYFERDREGRFIQSVKRLLPNGEFQGTTVLGQFISPEELVARFLREVRARVEKEVGPIDGIPVVMGRPARYSRDPAREGLAVVRFKKACELAGFGDSRYMEEPAAAALTYRSDLAREETVLVADLGGGTSDFTLMRMHPELGAQVLSTNGIPLAGDSLDAAFFIARLNRLFGAEVEYQRPFSSNRLKLPTAFTSLLPKWHQHAFLKERSVWTFLQNLHRELVDPKRDKPLLDNLLTLIEDNLGYALHQKVEALKVALSDAAKADFAFKSYPIGIEFPVERGEFEGILKPASELIAKAAADTLRAAKFDPSKLDTVYFTGGTSKVPLVRQAILAHFPQARIAEKDTFTSVAAGLALSAAR